ncbi:hypothetical protein ABIA32_000875 [Streptacidiphilus sp. MAP12-20]|uniref:hypothetical protein n=1 Tax=Streptacidiphilus sp. MAP12-20 TaxID=3156299 RepID=UPI003516E5A3
MSSNGGWWQPPTPPNGPPPAGPPYGPPSGQWPGGGPGGPYGPGGPGGPGGPAGPWGYFPQAPKPGVIPLRPLNVGEILSAIFATIRYNFLAVYGLVLITGLGVLAACAVFAAVAYSPLHAFWVDARDNSGVDGWSPSQTEVTNAALAFGGFFLLIALSSLAMYLASTLSGVATLRHAVVGRRVTMRQVVTEARPHVWRLLGATLLLGLMSGAAGILAVAFAVLLGLVSQGLGAAVGIGLLLYFGASVCAVYVQFRLVTLSAVVILEGARPVAAIRRAWRLNQGNWWRSFGISLLVGLIVGLISQVALMPLSLWAGSVSGMTNAQSSIGAPHALRQLLLAELLYFVLVLPVALAVNLLTLPMMPLTQGLLYIDQRIRRESLDVQLAEEAGIPFGHPHQSPPPGDFPPQSAAL